MNLGCSLLGFVLFLASIQCEEEWVVKLTEDQNPLQVASELGLEYRGPLKGPLGKRHHRLHSPDRNKQDQSGIGNPRLHRQQPTQRSKRDFSSSDPMWDAAWYFHGPQSYIDIMPVWEQNITGKGVVITIVDDGVQHIHPDLKENYLSEVSWDYNSNDEDPTPMNLQKNHHGTSCAGVAAAIRNNQHCSHGSAFEAKFGAIRLIEAATTDAQEAEALTHSLDEVDIYSCSWGPTDDGLNTSPAGPLIQEAIIHGITNGRDGKGTIYVWAAGNGADDGDNCNYDGLANQPYTIAIGALSHTGKRSGYSEPGAALFAMSPSSGDNSFILTTTTLSTGSFGPQSECTANFGGTSAATPLAAGMIALILQANPSLTWREVQHVIVESASKVDPTNPDWMMNGAGIEVNHEYGFGAINISKAIEVSRSWSKSIHYYHTFVSEPTVMDLPIFDNSETRPIVSYIYINQEDCFVKAIEHVQITVKTKHPKDTDLTFVLTSPAGTPSVLSTSHAYHETPVLDWTSWTENITKEEGYIPKMGVATFGPPMVELSGELFLVDPPKACTPLPPLDTSDEDPMTKVKKIALILRGDCQFYDKVLNAQLAGYDAVLIENTSPEPLNMNHDGAEDLVEIPSLMIGSTDGEILRSQFSRKRSEPGAEERVVSTLENSNDQQEQGEGTQEDLTNFIEIKEDTESNVRVNISINLKYYKTDSKEFSFADWTFMSVRLWGESPLGLWTLEVFDGVPGDVGTFKSWSLKISGASEIAPPPPQDDDDSSTTPETRSVILLSVLIALVLGIGLVWWYRTRRPFKDPKKFTALEIEGGPL